MFRQHIHIDEVVVLALLVVKGAFLALEAAESEVDGSFLPLMEGAVGHLRLLLHYFIINNAIITTTIISIIISLAII